MPTKNKKTKTKPRAKVAKKSAKKVIKKRVKTGKSKTPSLVLKKSHYNPIISPHGHHESWEGFQTFNPGTLIIEDKIHFLYRAIGSDGMSRLGYAASNNGLSIDERLSYPVFTHETKGRSFNVFSYFSGGSWGGAEDPRIVRVGQEDKLYMTYTACNGDLRVGLTSIKVDDFLNKEWNWESPVLLSPPNQLHKNWLLFPEKINGKYAFLLSIVPEIEISYFDDLDFDGSSFINSTRGFGPIKNNLNKRSWDKWVRGAGPVPLKTKHGWLVFYHAMDNDWSKYKVGAMLLDLNNPAKVIARAKAPVLTPSEEYEHNGFKGGVVYASGAVVKDGELLVYYGAADSCVCVAHIDSDEFIDALIKHKEPKLKLENIKLKA